MDNKPVPWIALRHATGLGQREVERRLGWPTGNLSLIERGLRASAAKEEQLRVFYGKLLTEPREPVDAQAQ